RLVEALVDADAGSSLRDDSRDVTAGTFRIAGRNFRFSRRNVAFRNGDGEGGVAFVRGADFVVGEEDFGAELSGGGGDHRDVPGVRTEHTGRGDGLPGAAAVGGVRQAGSGHAAATVRPDDVNGGAA